MELSISFSQSWLKSTPVTFASCGSRLVWRHARKCVRLQTENVIFRIQKEVCARVSVESKHLCHLLCIALHFLCNLFGQLRRAGLYRTSRFVFVLIIIEAFHRRDLDDRKRLKIDDADRKFSSFYIFLNDQLILPAERLL